jgi:CheY-like chemotaxis protein
MEKKKKILLVDDSSTTLMMERLLLSRSPYELMVARDGREAVTRATLERPDLILMDVVMPNMNGIDACRELKAQESTRNIPIIMVTTRSEAETMERGFASGCNDYVTKPIDATELLTKLRDQLGE